MSDRQENGLRIYLEVAGEHRKAAYLTEFSKPIFDYSLGACWNDIWDRPGLDRKMRSLLCIAMLTARQIDKQYLKIHIETALNNGSTLEELREVLLHAIPYLGFPAVSNTTIAVEEVLRERGLL